MQNKEKKEERYQISVAQKALIYDETNKKFLLLKASKPTEYFLEHYGAWESAGGKLEDSESLDEGLAREIREELGGAEVEVDCLLNVRKAKFAHRNLLMIDYLAKYRGGEIVLSDEHDEYRWETAAEIEKSAEYRQWLKDLIKKAEKVIQKEEYFDNWKRLAADFENYKKRQLEERKDLIAFSNQRMISEIIPVLDNFHASTEHIPEEQKDSPWVVGIMHIQRQLETVLTDNGVTEIETKIGDAFDPAMHEAIEDKDGKKDEECKNIIKKIVMRGYKMGGRVIRAARVIVE